MAGIKDQVSVIGMGCSRFGERFDASREDLILEAIQEALDDAGLELKDIDAFWLGTLYEQSGYFLSELLKTDYKPVTRVENNCCSGADTFRNACYGVMSGEYEVVMAIGIEKLKDHGFSGNPVLPAYREGTDPLFGGPASFSLLVPAYCSKYDISHEEMRNAMAHVSWSSLNNGALNPKALYQKPITLEKVKASPMIAEPYISIMDCSGVSDGCACAILTSTKNAHKYRPDPMYVKCAEFASTSGFANLSEDYDFTTIMPSAVAAKNAYEKVGITNPVEQLDLVELHDCFSITEIILYEDLQFSKRGEGWKDAIEGKYRIDGKLPVNVDGGLKAMGHPVGASGIRMIYESWLQFHGKAGKRQLKDPKLGLAHCLAGKPWRSVASVIIVGKELG